MGPGGRGRGRRGGGRRGPAGPAEAGPRAARGHRRSVGSPAGPERRRAHDPSHAPRPSPRARKAPSRKPSTRRVPSRRPPGPRSGAASCGAGGGASSSSGCCSSPRRRHRLRARPDRAAPGPHPAADHASSAPPRSPSPSAATRTTPRRGCTPSRTGSTSPSRRCPRSSSHAVLAAEDRDFFEHRGVDPIGIARAACQDIRGGGVQQGGSTITQQYVKLVYLTNERTITRKIKEAVLAIKLEQELSKEEILERYLNPSTSGGAPTASAPRRAAYFGKDVSQLDLAEAAYLAGLIRAPEAADATRDPEEASRRRRTVLDADARGGDASTRRPTTPPTPSRGSTGDTILRPAPSARASATCGGDEYGTTYFVEHVRQVAPRRVRLHRRPDLRRRPARLHDPRPRGPAGGVERGHRHPRPSRRPARPPSSPSTTRLRAGDDGRARLRRQRVQLRHRSAAASAASRARR